MQTSRRDFIRSASVADWSSGLYSLLPLWSYAGKSTQTGLGQRQSAGWCDWLQGHGVVRFTLSPPVERGRVRGPGRCRPECSGPAARPMYKKARGNRPQQYKDYRKMLENKDIDAVIIGTPDHWHCLALTDSLAAGKHVYCEKPLANSIEECNIMLAAAKRAGKIIQIGQWQRSGSHYEKAIEYVRSGKLGNIRLVKVWAYQGWMEPVPS
jgi:hypothetical protein